MKKAIRFLGLLFWLVAFASCRKSMKPGPYVQYVTDSSNGLLKKIVVDGWQYSIQYCPPDYIMLLESSNQVKQFDKDKRKEQLEGTAWFTITFRRIDNNISSLRYGISTQEAYNDRLSYFLNKASSGMRLVYGADTLLPSAYEFENHFNLTPQETMVVGFCLPKTETKPSKDMQFSYFDQELKTGIIKFLFRKKTLKNIPNLIR